MKLLVLVLLSCSCVRPAPIVRNVTTTVTVEPYRCTLPELPRAAVVVGYPNGALTDLLVTRQDLRGLLDEMAYVRAWMSAVAACVAVPQ